MKTVILPKNLHLPLDDILYLESTSNYTNVITRGKQPNHCIALTLYKVCDALSSNSFIRLNRSNVVNKSFIKDFTIDNNTLSLTLKNNKVFRTSRRRTKAVINCLIP